MLLFGRWPEPKEKRSLFDESSNFNFINETILSLKNFQHNYCFAVNICNFEAQSNGKLNQWQ